MAAVERRDHTGGTPEENFSRGLPEAEIAAWGPPDIRGKVRDIWLFAQDTENPVRVMVTTDRLSAYDHLICTVPGKGQVLNLLSADWFSQTENIIPNHMLAVPHPNVLIARQVDQTIPVEIVVRDYLARSRTGTSLYHNYAELNRRTVYGIAFPDGLVANQRLTETVLTPTTKAASGHDEELTDEEARNIVDGQFGDGMWERVSAAALELFRHGSERCREHGIILVDTKYEMGVVDGKPILIDELHTPDSSRFWLADTYELLMTKGENPDTFDKELIRRWLAANGFLGEGPVPVVPGEIIDQVSAAYRVPYEMITGKTLPADSVPWKGKQVAAGDPEYIFETTSNALDALRIRPVR